MKLKIIAKSPLSHGAFGGNDMGNYSMFRRSRLVNVNGYPQIPVISGNAIRGKLRRLIMTDLYSRVSMNFESFSQSPKIGKEGQAKRYWDKLYAALYNGGTIDTTANSINPEKLRELRKKFPMLSLFGSALYSVMLSGVVNIGFAYPYCQETIKSGYFEDHGNAPPANELLEDIGLTRHINRENADPEKSGVKPMPYEIETVCAGTVFAADIDFEPIATDIEKSCFSYAISLLNKIGGKASVGFGKITAELSEKIPPDKYLAWANDSQTFDNLIDLAMEL